MRIVVSTVTLPAIGALVVSVVGELRRPAALRGFVDAVAGLRVVPAGRAGRCGAPTVTDPSLGRFGAPGTLASAAAAGIAVALVRLDDPARLFRGTIRTPRRSE